MTDIDLIGLTADIVAAHVSHNTVATGDVPELIRSIHAALDRAGEPAPAAEPAREPAVSVRASIKPDYLVCLEDGKKLKMLKRYLRTTYGMTPDEYRAKWNLPRDYPMVAPNYAEQRRGLAHRIGLGRKKVGEEVAAAADTVGRVARRAVDAVEGAIGLGGDEAAATPAARKPRGIKAAKAAAQSHLGATPDAAEA